MDVTLFGRLMLILGSTVMAFDCLIAMRFKPLPLVLWIEAMLSLVFSFQAFTVLMAILSGSTVLPPLDVFIVINGAIHMTVAIICSGVLWGMRSTQ